MFSDGAWIYIQWDSRFSGLDEAGNPILEASGALLKGTSPCHRIQGTVEFINQQLPPSAEYPQAPGRQKYP